MNIECDWVFAPSISIEAAEELQEVFYFNSNQKRYRARIVNTISKYGKPKLVEENKQLTIRLDQENLNQQTLFVIDKNNSNKLIGVLIFVKETNTVNIIHLAFCEKIPTCKNIENISVFNYTINKLALMLKNFKDIKFIKFQYNSLVIELPRIYELLLF